jgi:DNA helicase-2/ATP-dependent DNA helicase PcrA
MTMASITDPEYGDAVNLTARAKEAMRGFRKTIEQLIAKIGETASSDRAVSDVVIAAIEDTGYANALRAENTDESAARLENLEELVNAAVDYDKQEENGLRDFIDHAALISDTDKYDGTAPVTLMTVHMAKGLEFPIVFLVGLEDGIFPHSRSINDPKELEEERRLAYVAITRAEKILYVTHSMRRRVYGEEMAAEPSQFLNEMPLELIEDLSQSPSWLSYARSSTTIAAKAAVSALRGEQRPAEKPKNIYSGKTYNSSEAVAEFFKNRGPGAIERSIESKPSQSAAQPKPVSGFDKLRAIATPPGQQKEDDALVPGSYVKHDKYGRGLVLRREGSGDNAKLTVSFPGFGQKKLIEKYANLQKI